MAPEIGQVLGLRTGLIVALMFGAAGTLAAALLADDQMPWLSAATLAIASAAGMVTAVLGRARLQRESGTAPLQAVLGFLHLASWAAIPVGALAGGLVARQTSVATAVVSSAGLWAVGAAVASLSQARATHK